jgi:hypothetical protein
MKLQGNLHLPKDKHLLEAELRKIGILVGAGNLFSPEKIQTPLNMVLAISPLFLLSTHLLANVSVGKAKILEVLPPLTCSFIAY